MGGITKALFGGSSNKSSSSNNAYSFLKDTLGGNVSQGANAMSAIGNFLGLGGEGGNAQAGAGLDNWLSSTGGKFMLDQGSKAITGNAAAKGLLNSGATAKALTGYGQNLAATQSQNYLGNLAQLAQLGLGSAGTIAGAGGVSTGKGSSQNGIIPGLFG